VKSRFRYIVSTRALLVLAVALVAAAPAGATTTENFHATFHDVAFQNGCVPPIVFCGSGDIDGFGPATTVVRVTRNVPIPGTACADVAGVRQMILDNGSGTLVATFTGTRCPLGDGGHASTVEFTWTIDGGASIGIFAGSAGGGNGINTTAGNVQVVSLTGTITVA
jgi:hypothetical protein